MNYPAERLHEKTAVVFYGVKSKCKVIESFVSFLIHHAHLVKHDSCH